jgi:hypothetical protein
MQIPKSRKIYHIVVGICAGNLVIAGQDPKFKHSCFLFILSIPDNVFLCMPGRHYVKKPIQISQL